MVKSVSESDACDQPANSSTLSAAAVGLGAPRACCSQCWLVQPVSVAVRRPAHTPRRDLNSGRAPRATKRDAWMQH